MNGNRVILAAHRGDRVNCPENTMPAFERAVAFGADMIETDVHMTKDGELILFHDRNTQRTTGHEGLTDQMTLAQIKTLDAGGWFSPEFQNTPVPTVAEFIAFIKDKPTMINWELKDYPTQVGDEFAFLVVDKLVELIEKNGLTSRSMFNSFSDRVLEYVRKKYGRKFVIHGQGILACQRTKDTADIPQTELYDWCCLYPDEPGKTPLDYPHNFAYCGEKGILPCVCVADVYETYEAYVRLGCRMFTSNNIYEADRILKMLGVR